MSNHELSNLLLLNEMVLVLDALSSSTSTSTATAEYEYEKQGKTSIDTPKHPNSATSKPAGRRGVGGVRVEEQLDICQRARRPVLRVRSESGGTRTLDPRIKSPLLYRLSYALLDGWHCT
jgi:hypothetical protein